MGWSVFLFQYYIQDVILLITLLKSIPVSIDYGYVQVILSLFKLIYFGVIYILCYR